jgi:hypothetical protein
LFHHKDTKTRRFKRFLVPLGDGDARSVGAR